MVRVGLGSKDVAAPVLVVLASLVFGLMLFTPSGYRVAGALGAVVLFLFFVWDIRLVVPILIITLPYNPLYTMSFGNVYLSTAVLILAYIAWLVRIPATKEWFYMKYNDVVLALLGLLLVFGLSSLQSYSLLRSNPTALLRFVQFMLSAGLFVMVWQMEFSRREIRALLALALVAGILQGFIGALQWNDRPGFYVLGTFGQHNIFSVYVTFMSLLVLGVILETRNLRLRLAGLVALAVMLYSIIFSFSRTAYASLLVSFLIFAALPISRSKRLLVPGVSLVTIAGALVIVPVAVAERMRDLMLTATGQYVVLSFRYRLEFWRAAYADFLENPILGKGSWAAGMRDNFFVKAGAEVGILGLAAFFIFAFLILRASWRILKSPPEDDLVRGIAVGFFPAAIGALIIFNLAGDFMVTHRFMGTFYILLALLLKYCHDTGRPEAQDA